MEMRVGTEGDTLGAMKQERKTNLQSSGTPQISVTLPRWFLAHSKVHGPLSLPRLCEPVRGIATWPLPTPGH